MQTEVDVLIIGAGPAGSTAAALLQREGFRLLVVEKQQFPRFVIGESLLPHCMDLLQEAGLLDCIAKQQFMQKTGAVFLQGNETCNFDFANQFTPGWKYTYQVTRADFDKALADEVASRGVTILFNHGVTAVNFAADHAAVTIKPANGPERVVTAKFVMDCSGYGRVLPRLLNLEVPSKLPGSRGGSSRMSRAMCGPPAARKGRSGFACTPMARGSGSFPFPMARPASASWPTRNF